MEKESCREVDSSLPYLGFGFLVIVVVNCIIRLLYSLKIWLSMLSQPALFGSVSLLMGCCKKMPYILAFLQYLCHSKCSCG